MAGELASVPTLKEQGINAVGNNFRILIAPPGMTPAQLAFWDQTTAKVVATDEWKKYLEQNLCENTYLGSRELRPFLEAEYKEMRKVLTTMGLAKE